MKNLFATFSFLFFLSVCSFGQIKFDDAFKISKKKSCYDLNIEKINFSNKPMSNSDGSTLKITVRLNNTGTMDFEQSTAACVELYDISGSESKKLATWDFNNLEVKGSETFEWELRHYPEDIFPTNVEAKIVLNGTFGECNLFNNSRLEEYEW